MSPPPASPDRSAAAAELAQRASALADVLPPPASGVIRWLFRPRGRAARIPLGVALIGGGALGFLPILGFWMLPVGLIVLAQDVPPLRRPAAKMLHWVERRLSARPAPPRP